ncbi:MAG: hypothetical protein ACE5KG_06645, partial [Nitrososphaerales archaeon]
MGLFTPKDPPSVVYQKVVENASKGFSFFEDEGVISFDRFRLVGIYDDRQYGYLMIRTRIPGGFMTSDQARVIGEFVEEFGHKPDDRNDEERFLEITTRQDIQLHWIKIEHMPELWRRYSEVGLTTFQACGNSTRNVTSCPVAGIDPNEAIDVKELVDEVNKFVLAKPELAAFLPRKFKTSISGCLEDCTLARINCISFTPARKDNRLGFHVWLGGGLSDYPRLATQVNGFVERNQVIDYLTRSFVLKPSLIATISILGLDFAAGLSNAFLVELIFVWPGLSRYGMNAILRKDLNAISAVILGTSGTKAASGE